MCGGKGRGGWTAGLGGVGGTRDEYMSPQVPLPLGANQSPPLQKLIDNLITSKWATMISFENHW